MAFSTNVSKSIGVGSETVTIGFNGGVKNREKSNSSLVEPATFLDIHDSKDIAKAIDHLVSGTQPLIIPFGNIIGLFSNPAKEHVESANLLKGRRKDQPGSVTTSSNYYSDLVAWDKLDSDVLPRSEVLSLIKHLSMHGPIGFILPAEAYIPSHLSKEISSPEGKVNTVQLIVPGENSPASAIFEGAVDRMKDTPFIFATSGNVSHRLTGKEGAAHHRFSPLIEEFAEEGIGGLTVVKDNEKEMRRRHPYFDPRSTTIINLRDVVRADKGDILFDAKGRPVIQVARHGSAHESYVREVLADHGFGVSFPEGRIPERTYSITEKVGAHARHLATGITMLLNRSITHRRPSLSY